jgi:hypothetical protein
VCVCVFVLTRAGRRRVFVCVCFTFHGRAVASRVAAACVRACVRACVCACVRVCVSVLTRAVAQMGQEACGECRTSLCRGLALLFVCRPGGRGATKERGSRVTRLGV